MQIDDKLEVHGKYLSGSEWFQAFEKELEKIKKRNIKAGFTEKIMVYDEAVEAAKRASSYKGTM